jgi:hypothetical protein
MIFTPFSPQKKTVILFEPVIFIGGRAEKVNNNAAGGYEDRDEPQHIGYPSTMAVSG